MAKPVMCNSCEENEATLRIVIATMDGEVIASEERCGRCLYSYPVDEMLMPEQLRKYHVIG